MITAIDTNIVLDLRTPGTGRIGEAERALTGALRSGVLVISEPVYAEMAAAFPERASVDRFLADTGIRLQPSVPAALYLAGTAWRAYRNRRPPSLACPQCGNVQDVRCERCAASIRTRQHIVADFLIGAHAMVQADRLLTRDRGFYATYFPRLSLLSYA